MAPISRYAYNAFASLRIRNYRFYFIGQGISLSGTWMQTVALGWLVLQLTHSGSQLGLVTALQFVPLLILGPWGGVMTDRLDKRRILLWTQTLFGLLAGLISILIYAGAIELWMIYVFALALGLVRIFDNPARQTFVSEMVPERLLKNAVSLNATENNLARAVGPSIGGLLIASVGIAFCFLFNALSYVAVIAMLLAMDPEELRAGKQVKKKRGQIAEGFRYAQGVPLIRDVLIIMALVGTFAYEFQVSLPILAEQTFHAGAAGYAALMTAFGLGAVVGGLFAAGRHRISMEQFVFFLFFFGMSIIGVSLAPTLATAVLGMFIVGIFSINVTSLGNTMIQLEALPAMRGRVMAMWSVAMIGSTPIGGPIVGFIGDTIGARWGVGIGAIAALLSVIFALATARKLDEWKRVPEIVHMRGKQEGLKNIKAQ